MTSLLPDEQFHAPTHELSLNSRFMKRAPTGVDRVASELANAIAELLERNDTNSTELTKVVPSGKLVQLSDRPPSLLNLPDRKTCHLPGHVWEQFSLAALDRKVTLLNLCNTGPAFRENQLVMIHDAQVFTQPQSYSKAFRTYYQWLLPKLGHNARHVVTVSEFSKKELEAFGVAPKNKIKVIHNGCDHIDRISPDDRILTKHGLAPQGFFLAIGSLAPHKNIRMLIDAASARSEGSPPLVIAGGGNKRIFSDAGFIAESNTIFLGRVSDQELKALYQSAIALAFPSLTEGFGLPPLEAMRCGCPVIASDGGAIQEICGDAFFVLPKHEISSWTNALVSFANEGYSRDNMVAAGFKRCEQFQWNLSAEKMIDLLMSGAD